MIALIDQEFKQMTDNPIVDNVPAIKMRFCDDCKLPFSLQEGWHGGKRIKKFWCTACWDKWLATQNKADESDEKAPGDVELFCDLPACNSAWRRLPTQIIVSPESWGSVMTELCGSPKFGCSCRRPVLVGFSKMNWLDSKAKANPLVTLYKCSNLAKLCHGMARKTLEPNAGLYFPTLKVDKVCSDGDNPIV